MFEKLSLEQSFQKAVLHEKDGDFQRAVIEYNQIIKNHPDHYESHFNLANIYDMLNATCGDLALEKYRLVFHSNPEMFLAWYKFGVLSRKLSNSGKYEDINNQFFQRLSRFSKGEVLESVYIQYAMRCFFQNLRNLKRLLEINSNKNCFDSIISIQKQTAIRKSDDILDQIENHSKKQHKHELHIAVARTLDQTENSQWRHRNESNIDVVRIVDNIQQIKSVFFWEDHLLWGRICDIAPYWFRDQGTNNDVLIVGNKPFRYLDLSEAIDSFSNIFRCNMSLPFVNNGTKFGRLALCNHLYQNLVIERINKSNMYTKYPEYNRSQIDRFFDEFDVNRYRMIFHAKSLSSKVIQYNALLAKIHCPYRFSKLPRTGYVLIFDNLLAGNNVFVTNFSIQNEQRDSYYVKRGHGENNDFHSANDELSILRWLHQNGYVDATLCLLSDDHNVRLENDVLEPSSFIMSKLNVL